jgi:hypothetical protein
VPNQITLHASAQASLDAVIQGAIDALCAESIQISAAGQVRVSGAAPIGRIILHSASDKTRAMEILTAHHINAN